MSQITSKQYHFFWQSKSCFSQWYKSSFVSGDGGKYLNAEQYMMAEKARLMGDEETGAKIMMATTPREIKQLGRAVVNFDSELWDSKKYEIVKCGNRLKFTQNSKQQRALINTRLDLIVEASPYDRIWGIGYSEADALRVGESNWGENLLGKILMELRMEFLQTA